MSKYRIGIVQQVWEEATIDIDADTQEEAETKAMEKIKEGGIEWRFLDVSADDGAEIVSCEVIT